MHNAGPQLFLCIVRFMQHEMCHKAWLFVTSAKNVTLPKSLSGEAKTRKYCVSTFIHGRKVTTEHNVACTHIKVSVSSGPAAKSCENGPQSAILDKGLHMICLKWKLPVNFMFWKVLLLHSRVYLGVFLPQNMLCIIQYEVSCINPCIPSWSPEIVMHYKIYALRVYALWECQLYYYSINNSTQKCQHPQKNS